MGSDTDKESVAELLRVNTTHTCQENTTAVCRAPPSAAGEERIAQIGSREMMTNDYENAMPRYQNSERLYTETDLGVDPLATCGISSRVPAPVGLGWHHVSLLPFWQEPSTIPSGSCVMGIQPEGVDIVDDVQERHVAAGCSAYGGATSSSFASGQHNRGILPERVPAQWHFGSAVSPRPPFLVLSLIMILVHGHSADLTSIILNGVPYNPAAVFHVLVGKLSGLFTQSGGLYAFVPQHGLTNFNGTPGWGEHRRCGCHVSITYQ